MSDDGDDNGDDSEGKVIEERKFSRSEIANIVDLKIPPSESQMGVADMRKNMDSMIEGHAMLAKLLRAKYLALIDEGFTKDQALELCKKLEY